MQMITAQTLPDKKDEAYKYTDLTRLTRDLIWRTPQTIHHHISETTQDWIHDLVAPDQGHVCTRSVTIQVQAGAQGQYIHHIAGSGGMVIDQINVDLEAGSHLHFVHVHMDTVMARTTLVVHLRGPKAHLTLNGIQILSSGTHGDITVMMYHDAPQTSSQQLLRHVVGTSARGVYQGKIIVDQRAKGTDATQTSNAILLAPGAEMDTRPELEIYADDIKCAHGATTGAIDDDQVFYLMSRGIPESEARGLLMTGFIAACFAGLPDQTAEELTRKAQDVLESLL